MCVRLCVCVFKSMLITFTDFKMSDESKSYNAFKSHRSHLPLGDVTNTRQQFSSSSATKPFAIIAPLPLSPLSVHASVADAAPFCPFGRGMAGLNVAHAALASAVSVVNAV